VRKAMLVLDSRSGITGFCAVHAYVLGSRLRMSMSSLRSKVKNALTELLWSVFCTNVAPPVRVEHWEVRDGFPRSDTGRSCVAQESGVCLDGGADDCLGCGSQYRHFQRD